ncbi:MAG TPA: YitT family protein [Bacteroidales bacterium]|nr:YitT family protein [Bacteroidales bacterium]HPE55299.1 YitT family protein [Bacteroidales bacterium]HRX95906.1 YitT family protein [Bacteroidales bacterium]
MAFITKEKLFSKKWFIAYSLIVVGTFIMAAGFVFFITPYKIVPGGVYGISIVLHHMFGTPVGLVALAFDIPLTILGVRILGPRFGIKTVVGFVLTAVFVDLLTWIYGESPLVEGDPLLSSIFGGVLVGLGLGLIFKSKATSGGSDIVAMIISKYTKLPLGQLMIAVDSVIVLVGLVAFHDWKIPLYSLIVIFITGRVIDLVLQGVSYDKTLFIISSKPQELRDKIINDLNRGGTFIPGRGMYNNQERTLIYTVVNRREMAMLQEFVHQIDPQAFMTVINANEILGNGFKSLREKVTD